MWVREWACPWCKAALKTCRYERLSKADVGIFSDIFLDFASVADWDLWQGYDFFRVYLSSFAYDARMVFL
jgi:hypothetical protein